MTLYRWSQDAINTLCYLKGLNTSNKEIAERLETTSKVVSARWSRVLQGDVAPGDGSYERRLRKAPKLVEVPGSPFSLADLAPRGCSWPVLSQGKDHLFCGAPKHLRGSYCPHHYYMSLQAPDKSHG